jgi:hypothetical protein
MRIVRNIGYVKRRKRSARLASVFGFFFLAATFPLVFIWGNTANLVVIAYALLFLGFILFNMGMQQLGKWANTARHPRNDLAIDGKLQTLPDKYTVIHYAQIGRKVVEHLVVYPGGVLVLTARDFPGKVMVNENRWRRRGAGLTRLFGISGPQLGHPGIETEHGMKLVTEALTAESIDWNVSGAVVFLAPTVELEITDPAYPTLLLDELPGFVRGLEENPATKNLEREKVVALLGKGEELEQPNARRIRRPIKVKRRAA